MAAVAVGGSVDFEEQLNQWGAWGQPHSVGKTAVVLVLVAAVVVVEVSEAGSWED